MSNQNIDLSVDFCGLKLKNPFLLSSSPVSNSAEMVARAFEAGWSGVVYKTLNAGRLTITHPSPRMNSYHYGDKKMVAVQNVEMISDRPLKDNLVDFLYLKKHYPELALFVQASPAFCCPALVTEAMAKEIELRTGIPMVTITYDGTGGCKNDIIIPYLRYSAAALKGRSIQPDCSSPC